MTTTDDGPVTEIQELLRRIPDLARVDVDAIRHRHGVPGDVVELCLDRERRRRQHEKVARTHTHVVPNTVAQYVFVRHLAPHGFTRGTSNDAYARAHHVTVAYVRAVRQYARDGASLDELANQFERAQ